MVARAAVGPVGGTRGMGYGATCGPCTPTVVWVRVTTAGSKNPKLGKTRGIMENHEILINLRHFRHFRDLSHPWTPILTVLSVLSVLSHGTPGSDTQAKNKDLWCPNPVPIKGLVAELTPFCHKCTQSARSAPRHNQAWIRRKPLNSVKSVNFSKIR